ncbi:MAG: DUF6339 family protein, partial [Ruminococcus sp.]|nr:DUF6339 family protein [Ruminococcus sp.]
WWIGRLTYDETRSDPYELTKYLVSDFATKSLVIFSNNFVNNKIITVGLFSALMQLEKEGFILENRPNRDIYYEATKFLNVLGGVCILDCFTSDEIAEKVIHHIKTLNSSSLAVL